MTNNEHLALQNLQSAYYKTCLSETINSISALMHQVRAQEEQCSMEGDCFLSGAFGHMLLNLADGLETIEEALAISGHHDLSYQAKVANLTKDQDEEDE